MPVRDDDGAMFGALFGVGAIILFPIFYGCMAFVMTLIQAALFNVAAGIVGGIEMRRQMNARVDRGSSRS